MRIDDNNRTRIDDDHRELPVTARETRIAKGIEHYELGSVVDEHAATAARMLAQNGGVSSPTPEPRFNDRILYVGMNTEGGQSAREAQELGVASNQKTVVVEHAELVAGRGADRVDVGSRAKPNVLDLSTKDGCDAFAASLQLPANQAQEVSTTLQGATKGSRDELAQIAQVWAKAETGGEIPSRLVLSGHCVGNQIYDNLSNVGSLQFDSIKGLAAALPKAAAQIEDVMISACSSGYDGQAAGSRAKLSDWSRTFPNLKTAWGYASENGEYHSPSQTQAVMHINAWEQATRGRVEDVHAKQSIDQYFIKDNVRDKPQFDGNVSTWTAARGYVEGKG